jgi:hypothetical protein
MDKNLNKELFDDFRNFLKTHECFKPTCHRDDDSDSMDDMMGMADEEIAEMAAKQANLFCQIRPKAVDILVEKEHEFLGAVKELIEKHKTLETVEQIEKLTKDILKLCK